MFFKEPSNNKKVFWTRHAKEKMRFYQLSETRLKKILRRPDREEEGIATRTVAIMQKAGTKKHPYEIWVMYEKTEKPKNRKTEKQRGKIKIISAWRYPGISPVGKPPIPQDILEELEI